MVCFSFLPCCLESHLPGLVLHPVLLAQSRNIPQYRLLCLHSSFIHIAACESPRHLAEIIPTHVEPPRKDSYFCCVAGLEDGEGLVEMLIHCSSALADVLGRELERLTLNISDKSGPNIKFGLAPTSRFSRAKLISFQSKYCSNSRSAESKACS